MMRAVLLLNESDEIAAWEHAALSEAIDKGLDIVLVAHCLDTPPRRVTHKNIAYYGMAYAALRSAPTTARVSITDLVPLEVPKIRFRAIHDGAWQRVPPDVAVQFELAEVVIKFGMTLLRGMESLPVRHGVLSYHHGAPEQSRGRPAGYYELLHGDY